MLTCKQVSKALADQDYETLPWQRKAALRLHVALCAICGPYNRQLMDLYDGLRGFRAYEDNGASQRSVEKMSDAQKQKLKEMIRTGSPS